MKRKIVSFFLICGMLIASLSTFLQPIYAGSTVNSEHVTVYGVPAYDFSFDFKKLTTGSNTKYSDDISKLAILMVSDHEYPGAIAVVNDQEHLLNQLGFDDVREVNLRDKYAVDANDFNSFIMGRRVVRTGKTKYAVYAISVSYSFFLREWISNLDLGSATDTYGEHPEWTEHNLLKGVSVAANRVQRELDSYIKSHAKQDKGMKKSILITGHSRGAAIANIIGKNYEDKYRNKGNIKPYTYTFAALNVSLEPKEKLSSYKTIFNIVNNDDVVPYMPPADWGLGRYGKDVEFSIEDSEELQNCWMNLRGSAMLRSLCNTYSARLLSYTVIPARDDNLVTKLLTSSETEYISAKGSKVAETFSNYINDNIDSVESSREVLYDYSIPAWIPKNIDESYSPYYIDDITRDNSKCSEARKFASAYNCKPVKVSLYFFIHAITRISSMCLTIENDEAVQAIMDAYEEISCIGGARLNSVKLVTRMLKLMQDKQVDDDIKTLIASIFVKTKSESEELTKYLDLVMQILKTDFLPGVLYSHFQPAYYLGANKGCMEMS